MKTWTPEGGARYLRERHGKRLDEISALVRVQRAVHHENDPDPDLDPTASKMLAAIDPKVRNSVVDDPFRYRLIAPSLVHSSVRVTVVLMHEMRPLEAILLRLVAHDEFGYVPLPPTDLQSWLVAVFNGQASNVDITKPRPTADPVRDPLTVEHEWAFRLPVGT